MAGNAAQIHYRHTTPEGLEAVFPVEQQFRKDHSRVTGAVRISEEGVVVEAMPDDMESRYRWLAFQLPGTNVEIKALGEFAGSCDSKGETMLRFKHLWPEARRELQRFLAAHVTCAAA